MEADVLKGLNCSRPSGGEVVGVGSEQLFASKYRTLLPTEAELIAELERERRVIEQNQIGGDT